MSYNTIYTTESFIDRSREVHGNFYDYSKSIYVQSDEKLLIICPEHGEFWQAPTRHMSGKGCYDCGVEKTKLKRDRFIEETRQKREYDFIKSVQDLHPMLSACDETHYINASHPVSIKCDSHGVFTRTPYSIIKRGCSLCSKEKNDTKNILKKLNAQFGDRYDYSKVYVSHDSDFVEIICPDHGAFKFRYVYLSRNDRIVYGCPECKKGESQRTYNTDSFIEKAISVHGEKYDYAITEYSSSIEKVLIRCKKHGFFSQKASRHLNGKEGCKKCLSELYETWAKRSKEDRRKRRRYKISGTHRKRAIKYGVYYEPVNRKKVFKRDKYRCQVCGVKTQKKDLSKDNSAELGHIVPMSKGGSHTYANTQCECKKCNREKSDKILNQQLTIFTRTEL